MGVRIQRHLGSVSELISGQFTTDPIFRSPLIQQTVFICCPLCGTVSQLSDDYKVSVAGSVTPSWSCAFCPMWDWIELEAWND